MNGANDLMRLKYAVEARLYELRGSAGWPSFNLLWLPARNDGRDVLGEHAYYGAREEREDGANFLHRCAPDADITEDEAVEIVARGFAAELCQHRDTRVIDVDEQGNWLMCTECGMREGPNGWRVDA